ncbi:hypothetical protein MMYC01_207636 [Madurella mycetomatis]|uniref:Protein PAR32 n=1 Tax=Madurella mycetomatis TaxID=100816 RepID=A0A175VVT0_9PEZI|nr:hypothetical protein MMYC01_207636 [Madurella mycetomatis]
MQSSGRGGAGNIVDSSKAQQLHPEDLQTPTLKTTGMVTTGRGGTGNMAANLDAEEKRRLQDVEPVVRRNSHGATHFGRGGTGNVIKPGSADDDTVPAREPDATEKERREKDGSPASADKNEEPGLVEKGKNLLFGKK